jgi:RNA polymerase sigma-70 factor, ECF subfamily
LSDQMRLVVQLVYYRGLKYREAAEVLSIPVGTVKSRLHAAVSKLSEIWNETHTHKESN